MKEAEQEEAALTMTVDETARALGLVPTSTAAETLKALGIASPTPVNPPRDLSKVFVVHGHDGEARQTVAQFIEKLGFEAVILHERPNKGRTIITKFREEAAGVGFAVVLMTPDDVGGAAASTSFQPRARQNVVFELGFFMASSGLIALQPWSRGRSSGHPTLTG